MDDIYLSVVIPVYNEAPRIGSSLETLRAFLSQQPYTSEIIVSDDGSTDASSSLAGEKLQGFSHQILRAPHKGKGHAVRRGMLAARGRYCLFSDADLSTPVEEVNRFLAYLGADHDAVIGSRALAGSHIEIRQPRVREWMGRFFNRLSRLMAYRDIRDAQCGFKGFRREAAREIFSRQKLDGYAFDAEIVYLAQKLRCRVLEVPVVWSHCARSRVNLVRDPVIMLFDLLRIRWLHRAG